jgi:L-amino acid N-acyltransferase YncA
MSTGASGTLVVEPMTLDDGPTVLDIFGQGIATGMSTFETVTPGWDHWDAEHRSDCRFVARLDGRVVGWTALGPWSSRESVYVDAAARGSGVGRALLATLIPASEAAHVWTLIAGVQVENTASLALHEHAGFRRIGVQERVGRDATGAWRDVVLLERLSLVVGA